jgi:hypothetical protein
MWCWFVTDHVVCCSMAAAEDLQYLLREKEAELQNLRHTLRDRRDIHMQRMRGDLHRAALDASDQLSSDMGSMSGCSPRSYQHHGRHGIASEELPIYPMQNSLISENESLQRELDRMYVHLAVCSSSILCISRS